MSEIMMAHGMSGVVSPTDSLKNKKKWGCYNYYETIPYRNMNQHPRPNYTNKNSIQTLREGLEEYYQVNPYITDPRSLPPDFAKILLAHDVTHIILGLDTNMYDELKLLPLCFWTSDYKLSDYIRTVKDPSIKQAIGIMYNDLIKQHGAIWLYSSIFLVLPRLLPEVITIWWKTRGTRNYYPFFDYESWFDHSLLEIRQQFDLLSFLSNPKDQV